MALRHDAIFAAIVLALGIYCTSHLTPAVTHTTAKSQIRGRDPLTSLQRRTRPSPRAPR